jgi:O-antigen/teichoic acid export membrane protein
VVAVVTLLVTPSIFPLVLVWGLSGVAAGIFGCLQAGSWPKVGITRELWRAHRRLGPRFVGEFIVSSGQAQLTLLFLAAYAGTAASAGFRGAQVVFGPQRVLTNGLTLGLLPEAVRLREDRRRLRGVVLALSTSCVVIVALSLVVLLALPDRIGVELLGQTWIDAQPLLLPIGLYAIAGSIAAGPSVGLRSIGDASACLRNQSIVSVTALVTTVIGIVWTGSSGAAWGLMIAGWIGAAVWTLSWSRAADAEIGPGLDPDLSIDLTAQDDLAEA